MHKMRENQRQRGSEGTRDVTPIFTHYVARPEGLLSLTKA